MTPNIYPNQLRTILAYVDALNLAERAIINSDDYDTEIILDITVRMDNCILGSLADEVGGAWSFQPKDNEQ